MLKTSTLKELGRIVGASHLHQSPEECLAYSYDATKQESLPWAVVQPGSAAEVAEIVALANRDQFPVVPRGAGTGMSGGSVPVHGGVVLSLERMNKIIEISDADFLAVVEPGVVTADLQRAVEARGLFYPPDPASGAFCTLGGNVAECAGGLRAVKYGVTKDYVLGLEVVLPTGELITTGARTVKSVAGYDLTKLIVGSEGTLGVVTKIMLRLLPLPAAIRTVAAYFSSAGDAARAASAILSGNVLPRALELADRASLRAVEAYLKYDIANNADAMLLIEVDGSAEEAEREQAAVVAILEKNRAMSVRTAASAEERDKLWKARRSISAALYSLKPRKLNEDIVVPRSRIVDALHAIEQVAARRNLLIANFGHAGDGNLHVNIMADDAELPQAKEAVREVFAIALELGGSISGEHGIGLSKAAYLPMESGPAAIEAMKRIKHALDPNNILNPGKIFIDPQTT
jgi:glycolate oxidase